MKVNPLFANVILTFTILTSFAHPAHAYLDLGTGSFMLQMLIASLMGGIYTVKLYWYKIKATIMKLLGKEMINPMDNSLSEKDVDEDSKS